MSDGQRKCTVDEQQCDAECQARPDRACATETKTESVYERARKALKEMRDSLELEWKGLGDQKSSQVLAALDAGEAAEKRANDAEKREEKWRWMVREAELRSIPNRIQQQNLLQEASGKYRKRAEEAERERDALKARVKECEAALKAVSTDIAQDALEDPIGHDERKRAGWYQLFEGTMGAVRSALDPPKEG